MLEGLHSFTIEHINHTFIFTFQCRLWIWDLEVTVDMWLSLFLSPFGSNILVFTFPTSILHFHYWFFTPVPIYTRRTEVGCSSLSSPSLVSVKMPQGVMENPFGVTITGEKSNKCNQCDYASSRADSLRSHLKKNIGEKSNKWNLCGYATVYVSNLRDHLKIHNGEKSNKCNQCEHIVRRPLKEAFLTSKIVILN